MAGAAPGATLGGESRRYSGWGRRRAAPRLAGETKRVHGMRMTSLGQAGLVVEAARTTIVCDPRLCVRDDGNAGWDQVPANQHLLPWLQAQKIDYVYLSQAQLDCCDEEMLAALPKDAAVLVAAFPSEPWRARMQGLGFARVEFLETFQERELAPGLWATIVLASTPSAHDSALILEDQRSGQVIVNLNACTIDAAQQFSIRAHHPQISAVLARFSGATVLPSIDVCPGAERVAAVQHCHGMRRWYDSMRALAPEWTVPIAGSPAILEPQTGRCGRGTDTALPTFTELMDFLLAVAPDLAESTPLLLPGDVLDLDRQEVVKQAEADAAFF